MNCFREDHERGKSPAESFLIGRSNLLPWSCARNLVTCAGVICINELLMQSISRNLGGTTGIQTHTRPFVDEYVFFYFYSANENTFAKKISLRRMSQIFKGSFSSKLEKNLDVITQRLINLRKKRKGEVVCQIKK